MTEIVKSVSYSQKEIIQNILKLHVPQGYIDVDPTYSKGNFYKSGQQPIYKFDIKPQIKGIIPCSKCLIWSGYGMSEDEIDSMITKLKKIL